MANKDVGLAFDSVFDGQPKEPEKWNPNGASVVTRISYFNAEGQETVMFDGARAVSAGEVLQWEWKAPLLTPASPILPEHDRIRRDLETSLFGGWEPVELPIDPVELEKERVRMGHKNTYVAKAAPSPVQVVGSDPHPACRTCWGLGFVPGTSGRHVTCEDCGYDMVEFK